MKWTILECICFGAIILIGSTFISGCSYQPAINAAEKAALQSVEAANDNLLEVNTLALCAMPYRTVLRHPETWPWINKMCAPGVAAETPATLLSVPR